jgi:hypothetical protein
VTLRLYLCDIIGDGLSPETAFRTGLSRTSVMGSAPEIKSNLDGRPKFSWVLAVARSSDWTVQDADPTLTKLFGIDLPDTIDSFADLKAFLQSKTVADIPAARRIALNTNLTSRGIDTSQVTLATTWWQVLRGIVQFLNSGIAPADDGISI